LDTALQELLGPAVGAMGYELLGVQCLKQRRGMLVRVYIDHEDGITLDDCERVSHQVSGILDVEDPIRGEYTLEVSSPGFDRPLFTPEHFTRFMGRRVRVQLYRPLAGRRRFSGILQGFEAGQVLLVEEGALHTLPFDQIEKARLVPDDEELSPPKRKDKRLHRGDDDE
jgi:ribosome maturation factor RimP